MLLDNKKLLTCPICGSKGALFGEKSEKPGIVRLVLLSCENCGHKWKPYKPSAVLGVTENITHRNESTQSEWVYDQIPLEKRNQDKIEILDIGCWEGEILCGLPNSWIRTGIELNFSAANKARQKGLNILNCTFEEAYLEVHQYDIVIFLDVLEHIMDPINVLKKIYSILNKNGILIAMTGGADCLSSKVFRSNWYYYNYEEHINFFTRESLSIALQGSGFSDHQIESIVHPASSFYKSVLKAIKRTTGINKRNDTTLQISRNMRDNVLIVLNRLLRGKDHYLIIAKKEQMKCK